MGSARGRWGSILGVAAVALAVAMVPSSGAAGPLPQPPLQLKVSKHKDGPYRSAITHTVPTGAKKSFYWRAKNTASKRIRHLLLRDLTASYPSGWRATWFRGEKKITGAVQGAGYEFTLKRGKSKVFRLSLRGAPIGFCVFADAGKDSLGFDAAALGLNGVGCTP